MSQEEVKTKAQRETSEPVAKTTQQMERKISADSGKGHVPSADELLSPDI